MTSTGSESDSKQVAIVVAPSPKREVQPLDQLMSEKQLQAASLYVKLFKLMTSNPCVVPLYYLFVIIMLLYI